LNSVKIKASEEKTALEEKVTKMKQSILNIRSKLDNEIYKKFEAKDLLIRDLRIKLELSEK